MNTLIRNIDLHNNDNKTQKKKNLVMELLRLDSGDACKLSNGHKVKFMKHTDKASESSQKPVKSKEDQVRNSTLLKHHENYREL